MYVLGYRLSLFRLCGSDFGITPVDDITNGINRAVFCFHIAHISFASSWYLFWLSVIVLARLCVFGTAMSIRKVFLVFLFMNVISGRLKGTVLSVSMLRFQYSLKLSFSSTLLLLLLLLLIYHRYLLLQGVYTYIPETKHVPREHFVAAILMLLFMVRRSLVSALTPSLR